MENKPSLYQPVDRGDGLPWFSWISQLRSTRSTTTSCYTASVQVTLGASLSAGFGRICRTGRSMYAVDQQVDHNPSDTCSFQGPVLFVPYTVDLIPLMESRGLSARLYADDTQVYGSCRPADVLSFSTKLCACVHETSGWRIKSNGLQSRILTPPRSSAV